MGRRLFDSAEPAQALVKSREGGFHGFGGCGDGRFSRQLAIVGPVRVRRSNAAKAWLEQIQKLARKGVAVVWIQPPPEPRDPIKPSFYACRRQRLGRGRSGWL